MTGGNTFFLLQELKRTDTDKVIIDEVNAGKLYIVESAGAKVTAPNIEYVKGMDAHSFTLNLSPISNNDAILVKDSEIQIKSN